MTIIIFGGQFNDKHIVIEILKPRITIYPLYFAQIFIWNAAQKSKNELVKDKEQIRN